MRNCEVKYPVQGYTALEWWSHSSDPGDSTQHMDITCEWYCLCGWCQVMPLPAFVPLAALWSLPDEFHFLGQNGKLLSIWPTFLLHCWATLLDINSVAFTPLCMPVASQNIQLTRWSVLTSASPLNCSRLKAGLAFWVFMTCLLSEWINKITRQLVYPFLPILSDINCG